MPNVSFGRGIARCGIAIGSGLLSIDPSAAGPIFTPSATVSESYNDNVNLAPPGTPKARDWITTLTPSLSINDYGARVTMNIVYSRMNCSLREIPRRSPSSRTVSSGQIELHKDTLFLEERASIDQQLISGTAPVGATTLTTSNNSQLSRIIACHRSCGIISIPLQTPRPGLITER